MSPEEQQQQDQQRRERLQKMVGNSAKRKLGKAGKKAAKHAAKVLIKGFAMALKAALSFVLKIVSPYILIGIGIVILAIVLFAGVTMLFSGGSDDQIGEVGVEIRDYAEKKVQASVDASKPEQLAYAVPVDLVYAILQLFNGESRTEKEIHEAIDIVVDKLKPQFEYDEVTEKTETETTTCDRNGCTTSESSGQKKVTYLSHVEAWNGTLDVEMQGAWGEWVTTSSSYTTTYTDEEGNEQTDTVTVSTKTRQYTYNSSESWVEDYTAYERILTNDPFNYSQKDLIFIEQLYKMTGGVINYSLIQLGIDDGSGLDNNYNFDGANIIPGAGVPAEYMKYYLAGEKAYKVDWFLLAAVHFIETKWSTHEPMISYAGAEGHMQFMPCTFVGWSHPTCSGNGKGNISQADKESPAVIKKYGGYGVDADGDGKASMWSLADSIMTAAKYLASGGNYSWNNRESVHKAIRRYNHSTKYVNDVYAKAVEIKDAAKYIEVDGGGDDAPTPSNSYGFIAPTTGKVTSSWGTRYVGGRLDIHRAMDIGGNYHRNVYAIADGTITKSKSGCGYGQIGSKCGGGWGNHVRISHTIKGTQFESIYGHMEAVFVSPGPVKQGTIIGKVGSSGSSTGPHLHIEIHSPKREGPDGEYNALNPIKYLPPIPAN